MTLRNIRKAIASFIYPENEMLAEIAALKTAADNAIASATATKAVLVTAQARVAELEADLVDAQAMALTAEDKSVLADVTQRLADSAVLNSATN